MTAFQRFEAEAQAAGADISIALRNLENGLCWQEAIDQACPNPRLDLPPVTVEDALRIDQLVNEAEAACAQAAAQVRTLLQQRDLVSVWDDEDAAFCRAFEPTALTYYRLMRALLALKDEPFGWEHQLRWMVEAQK